MIEFSSGIRARAATDADLPLLRHLFDDVRRAEFLPLAMPPEQLDSFLGMQFQAQQTHYRTAYPDADWFVLLRDGEPVGNLTVATLPNEIRLMDIALREEHRGKGIGSNVVRSVMEYAAKQGKPLLLHVETLNRARHLYYRLGFEDDGIDGAYYRMIWKGTGSVP